MAIPKWLYNTCPNPLCDPEESLRTSGRMDECPQGYHYCITCGFKSEPGAWLFGRHDTKVVEYHDTPSLETLINEIESFHFTPPNPRKPDKKQRYLHFLFESLVLPPPEWDTTRAFCYDLRLDCNNYKSVLLGMKIAASMKDIQYAPQEPQHS